MLNELSNLFSSLPPFILDLLLVLTGLITFLIADFKSARKNERQQDSINTEKDKAILNLLHEYKQEIDKVKTERKRDRENNDAQIKHLNGIINRLFVDKEKKDQLKEAAAKVVLTFDEKVQIADVQDTANLAKLLNSILNKEQ